jgi:sugar phosphate isomerase/epimerase
MRLRHSDGTDVHLAYCGNVHRANDLDGLIDQLARHAEPVREQLGADLLGIGLWLAHDVVTELADHPENLARLRAELRLRGLETVTLNAFPYYGFHHEVVKKDVFLPDWADEARLRHTLACARVLAALLPDDVVQGSISTLPLAWRTLWSARRAEIARRALDRLTAGLADVHADTGRRIRVGFEPEPGCVVENTAQAARELRGLDPEWLGVCIDASHLAVEFELPGPALARLAEAGLPVVKLQASCAIQADDPADPAARSALRRLAERRYLHQTRTFCAGAVLGVDDLSEALDGGLQDDTPWRVHFHAPLHIDPEPPLRTTVHQLTTVLGELLSGPEALCDHVEVETYTWPVLPEPCQDPRELNAGIAAELGWVRDRMVGLGLKEVTQSSCVWKT